MLPAVRMQRKTAIKKASRATETTAVRLPAKTFRWILLIRINDPRFVIRIVSTEAGPMVTLLGFGRPTLMSPFYESNGARSRLPLLKGRRALM
jgi:hypothetical protein